MGPCPGPVPAGERLSPPRGRRREKPGLAELPKRGTKRRAAFAINNAAERSLQLLSERERGGGTKLIPAPQLGAEGGGWGLKR